MDIIPPRLKEPAYRLYELRLRQELAHSKAQLPRHIAVLCDGNRRWARSIGLEDVNAGHRVGADKIVDLLRWCDEARVEVVTLFLLSTDNLQRPAPELTPLLRIIEGVACDLAGPGRNWHLRAVGARLLADGRAATAVLGPKAGAGAGEAFSRALFA